MHIVKNLTTTKKHYSSFKSRNGRNKSLARKIVLKNKRSITPAEKFLKDTLISIGAHFTFQKDIHHNGFFRVADFYFPRGRLTPLIVEVDGGYHENKTQKEKDEKRTEFLKQATGCELIRFENKDILQNINAVINSIKKYHIFIHMQT